VKLCNYTSTSCRVGPGQSSFPLCHFTSPHFVCDIAIFGLKRDGNLQQTNLHIYYFLLPTSSPQDIQQHLNYVGVILRFYTGRDDTFRLGEISIYAKFYPISVWMGHGACIIENFVQFWNINVCIRYTICIKF